MNTQNNTPNNEINVGIDTSKLQLDIYIRPLDIFFSAHNNTAGAAQAIETIKSHKPKRVLIEATGRLEIAFFCQAHKAKFPL